MTLDELYQEFNEAYQKWANAPRPEEPNKEFPDNFISVRRQHLFREREWFEYTQKRNAYLDAVSKARLCELH